VARTEVTVLSCVALAVATLYGLPVRAQEAPSADAPAVAPAPEAAESVAAGAADAAPTDLAEPAPPVVCPAATSLKQCTAACSAQFPPKPKIELPEDATARARLGVHGWWALGAGVALLIGGGITGGVALHLNKELSKECESGSCPPAQHAVLDTRDRLAVTSTVLIAGGVAASAVGILILAVFARTPKMSDDEREGPAAALIPAVGPGIAGAAVAWRF
jgi:hypothetical protein